VEARKTVVKDGNKKHGYSTMTKTGKQGCSTLSSFARGAESLERGSFSMPFASNSRIIQQQTIRG
jgi:hypothetical protein